MKLKQLIQKTNSEKKKVQQGHLISLMSTCETDSGKHTEFVKVCISCSFSLERHKDLSCTISTYANALFVFSCDLHGLTSDKEKNSSLNIVRQDTHLETACVSMAWLPGL